MLPRGRPPGPGTAEEKAAIRREKVRLNVKAYRERKKNALSATSTTSSTPVGERPSPSVSTPSTIDLGRHDQDRQSVESEEQTNRRTFVVRSNPRSPGHDSTASRSPREDVLYRAPSSSAENITAFLSIFRRAFLPSNIQLPTEAQANSILLTPCSPWIMNAYNLAMQQDSGALQSGLLAVALTLSGKQNSNSNLEVASLNMHRRAISQLRNDLVPVASRQRKRANLSVTVPFLSCLSLAMFELVQNGFTPAIVQHTKALNSLIEIMYSDPSVDTLMADLITEDFGMLEILLCIKYGMSSTLRHTRKRILSKRRGHSTTTGQRKNASVYGDIFDIIEDLPSLILDSRNVNDRAFSETAVDQLQHIIRRLIRIQGDLDAWYMYFEVRHGSIMMQEDLVDEPTGRRGMKVRLRSYEHGAVGLYILNFHLCALDANIEATYKLIQLHESQQSQTDPVQAEDNINFVPASPVNEAFVPSEKSVPLNRPTTSIFHREGFLHEQLRQQRTKARTIVMQLIELMTQFQPLCVSVPGQAIMIVPCEMVKMVLDKEQMRTSSDLKKLRSDDHEGAIEIHKYARIISRANDIFDDLERSVRQHKSAPAQEVPAT